MVPKSGTRLPNLQDPLSEARLADLVGRALQHELGASRRAAKTVMAWTGVSDHTARAWLNGRTSPSGLHLILLAAHCPPVMSMVLRLAGHEQIAIAIDLESIERGLEEVLAATRRLRPRHH